MTPESFRKWLKDMKAEKLARSDAECAKLLGVSANAVVLMKQTGSNERTALACQHLLDRGLPYR